MGVKIRLLKKRKLAIFSGLIFVGGTLLWQLTDRTLFHLFEHYQSLIEKNLSKPLGRPIRIGSYQGLRLWGVEFGQTNLESGYADDSSATFSSIKVSYSPLSSLLNWKPVFSIKPEDTILFISSNEEGSILTLGSKEGKAPNLKFNLNLHSPARIILGSSEVELNTRGKLSFDLSQKKFNGSLQGSLLDGGNFFIKSKGFWNKLKFKALASFNKVDLESISNIYKEGTGLSANGLLDGNIQMNVDNSKLNCSGGIDIYKLQISGGPFPENLSTPKTSLLCKDNLLSINRSIWRYGPIVTSLDLNIPIQRNGTRNLNFNSSISLDESPKSTLDVTGFFPVDIVNGELNYGDLNAILSLKPFPLASINKFLGPNIAGTVYAKGEISGQFGNLKTNLSVALLNPQFGGVRLQEEWSGKFLASQKEGGELSLSSIGAALPSSLSLNLSSSGKLLDLSINRLGGTISVKRFEDEFRWNANNFRLDRVELAIPPVKSFKRIFGKLSGNGNFIISTSLLKGELFLQYPRLMDISLKEANLAGTYSPDAFNLQGVITPLDSGYINLSFDAVNKGPIRSEMKGAGINARWIADTITKLQSINLNVNKQNGRAKDIGKLSLISNTRSLDRRINRLKLSKFALRNQRDLNPRTKKLFNPKDIKGELDISLVIEGPNNKNMNLEMEASGDLKPRNITIPSNELNKPFKLLFKGPISNGKGDFSIDNIPFSLLKIFLPLPKNFSGLVGFSGKYKLLDDSLEMFTKVYLNKAFIDKNPFYLETGSIDFIGSYFNFDISFRGFNSSEKIFLKGFYPLNPTQSLSLKLEAHGDAIRFLDALTDNAFKWREGRADLKFLITGSPLNPVANGFLVIQKGDFIILNKRVNNFDASIIFDFDRLEVQRFEANVGKEGNINGKGSIALFNKNLNQENKLVLNFDKVPIKIKTADVKIDSKLILGGSVVNPLVAGELNVKQGSISPKRPDKTSQDLEGNNNNSQISNTKSLPEQKWDMKKPLILFVSDNDSNTTKDISKSLSSKFSFIRFDNLKLRLGPDLRITSQPLATFKAAGLLTLNGALDQSLNLRGIVRLISGRVNLFTTTFNLDRKENNVAIFTPSMGLVPYLDVTMLSRVPDTVRDISQSSNPNDFAANGSNSFGIGGSRFVKVELKASGPADRLSDNFQLRSNPPLPRNELLALIGGNSLSQLLTGGEGQLLADVLSRSLISPILGNITGNFSERLKVALYPAYVANQDNPEEGDKNGTTLDSSAASELAPQQAWVTEVGLDLTDSFNFSIQATPDREDIPPQGTLTYQLNSNIGVLGSLDKEGKWQSQFQLFLRF